MQTERSSGNPMANP